MAGPVNLEGQTFGRLYVEAPAERSKHGQAQWKCQCKCGNTKIVLSNSLRRGLTTSCGCFLKERQIAGNTRHGHCHKGKFTRTYRIWSHIKTRCFNPKSRYYKDYGGRGIKVCQRWMKFENFLADMGECPPGLTIERKNNDLGYFFGNCKWATQLEQNNNKRNNIFLVYKGIRMSLPDWARKLNRTRDSLYQRKRRGWSDEKTIIMPVRGQL